MYSLSLFFPISSFARGKAKQLADRSDLIPFFLSPMDSESTPGVLLLTSDPPFFHSCWAYTYLFLLFLIFLLSQLLLIHLCSALTDWTRSRGFSASILLWNSGTDMTFPSWTVNEVTGWESVERLLMSSPSPAPICPELLLNLFLLEQRVNSASRPCLNYSILEQGKAASLNHLSVLYS